MAMALSWHLLYPWRFISCPNVNLQLLIDYCLEVNPQNGAKTLAAPAQGKLLFYKVFTLDAYA